MGGRVFGFQQLAALRRGLATLLAVAGLASSAHAQTVVGVSPDTTLSLGAADLVAVDHAVVLDNQTGIVVASGIVELLLGAALILSGRRSAPVGVVVAGFFVVIFPGNIAQFLEGNDAFGLDSDASRFVRLLFQPVLVLWALWSTGGWRWLRTRWDQRT